MVLVVLFPLPDEKNVDVNIPFAFLPLEHLQ